MPTAEPGRVTDPTLRVVRAAMEKHDSEEELLKQAKPLLNWANSKLKGKSERKLENRACAFLCNRLQSIAVYKCP